MQSKLEISVSKGRLLANIDGDGSLTSLTVREDLDAVEFQIEASIDFDENDLMAGWTPYLNETVDIPKEDFLSAFPCAAGPWTHSDVVPPPEGAALLVAVAPIPTTPQGHGAPEVLFLIPGTDEWHQINGDIEPRARSFWYAVIGEVPHPKADPGQGEQRGQD